MLNMDEDPLERNVSILNTLIKSHEEEIEILKDCIEELRNELDIVKESFLEQNEIIQDFIEKNDFSNFVQSINSARRRSFIREPKNYHKN
jgi:hypothetical protein